MPTTPRTKPYFPPESTDKVKSGIDILARAVSSTLGPKSRAVGMDHGFMWKINKDGVSVAKSILLEDPLEDFGVKVVREAAQKTVDEVGDGTTVTVVLAHSIITEAQILISSGVSPMALRPALEKRMDQLIKHMEGYATPVKNLQDKVNVATISASGDLALGQLIAETLNKIGDQGVLTVEDTKELETTVDMQEGIQFDKGMVHPLFMTDPIRNTSSMEDVPVLITDKPLKEISELGELLNKVIYPKSKQLVLIAPEISGSVLSTLLQNKLDGNFLSLPINAPFVGTTMREFLQDLCAITNAKFVSAEANHKLSELTYEDLGIIPRITSNRSATIITGSNTKTKAVQERISLIKRQMEEDDITDFEREKYKERLGKLTQGIAVLKLGGSTKVEMEERKERAIDAIAATQAAIRSGVIPGGEVIYLKLRNFLAEQKPDTDIQRYADSILVEALKAPFYTLLINSGMEPGEWLPFVKGDDGVDVTDGKVKDLIKAGIIDPLEVAKSALQNALSVAIQIITLGAVVVMVEEKK